MPTIGRSHPKSRQNAGPTCTEPEPPPWRGCTSANSRNRTRNTPSTTKYETKPSTTEESMTDEVFNCQNCGHRGELDIHLRCEACQSESVFPDRFPTFPHEQLPRIFHMGRKANG